MAITVTINEYNGTGETKTTGISSIMFGSTDAASFTAFEYPIRSGESSYDKYLKVAFAGIVAETISAATVHMSTGKLETGETITYKGLGPVDYATPTQTASGNDSIPTSAPGSQNLALGGSDTGTLVADGESDYFQLQRNVTVESPSGALDGVTLTVTYDAS